MNNNKPSIPRGTRDFGPEIMVRRNFILETIKNVYQLYGFAPMETPAMENLSVLTGKYGAEGDQLIFKILNSGDFMDKVNPEIDGVDSKKLLTKISEKALRYDLTVPFARYVVMNKGNIILPFKRFQIQPVWRADRPQRGRYREFYQCDADVVGTTSLVCEAEIIQIICEVFKRLNIVDFTIKINNRKILEGIAALFGESDKLTAITVAIDKLDKVGAEAVTNELVLNGIQPENAQAIMNYFVGYKNEANSNKQKLEFFQAPFALNNIAIGVKGINELLQVMSYISTNDTVHAKLEFDPSLARGLSYYTGAIFEVKVNNVQIGSVSGGGRYDNLTGVFGMPDVSGVGISFGVDRIYDVMEELGLFPMQDLAGTKTLICCLDEKNLPFGISVANELRSHGVATEIYPDISKIKKQLDYANRKNIPYVVIIGEEEIAANLLVCKDMRKGEQVRLSVRDIVDKINQH